MLAASPMTAAGDYVVFDSTNADPDDVDIVVLANGTTGLAANGVVASTSTADPDVVNLVINDPDPAAANDLVINLITTGPLGTISYNGSAGDTIKVNVVMDGITYTNATTLVAQNLSGHGFTIPAATAQTNPGDLQGAIADGDSLSPDGNIGGVSIDADTTFRGGLIQNFIGNIGTVALSGALDLANAASIPLVVTPGGVTGQVGSVTVGGVTTIGNVPGGNAINLTTGTGTVAGGPVTFGDINFNAGIADNIAITSADGSAAISATSVDFLGADGAFVIETNSNGDAIGNLASFTVASPGNDATGPFPNVAFIGSISTVSSGPISIAGGAQDATFNALTPFASYVANTGGTGTISSITFGAGGVADSASDNVTINTDDGLAALSVLGPRGTLTDLALDVNVDALSEVGAGNAIGELTSITVTGLGGSDSLTGTAQALRFGANLAATAITLTNGNMNLDLTTVVNPADSGTVTTSTIGAVSIPVNGAITGGTWTADDGIGNVTVVSIVPINGTIGSLGDPLNLISDADNVTGAPAGVVGGTIGNLTATGGIFLGTVDTTGTVAPRPDTVNVAQNIGAVTAGDDIVIASYDIGGNAGNIFIIEPLSNTGPNTITANGLNVNGNLDVISSAGGAGDDVTVNGVVQGDMDKIFAGLGDVAGTINIQGLSRDGTNPLIVVSEFGTDYIIDVRGTFSGTMDVTLIFPVGPGAPTVIINDIDATTDSSTRMVIATRANPLGVMLDYSAGLGTDNSTEQFNVGGIFFCTPGDVGDIGRNNFGQILIEGDLSGPIGAAENAGEASVGTAQFLANPNNCIAGVINNLEIQGVFDNANFTIFALNIQDLSFGGLTADAIAAQPGNQFSLDSPTLGIGDGVPPGGGNANGVFEDVELFQTVSPANQQNVPIPIPEGGSITKTFIGPTGGLETITFCDIDATDGIINTVLLSFDATGHITSIYLFGENIGIEYNALDPANPATTSSTNIFYGFDQGGLTATNMTEANENAIEFLEFSSSIGDVSVNDVNEADAFVPNVGDIKVGYLVVTDCESDIFNAGGISVFINDPNNGTGATGGLGMLRTDAAGNIVYGSVGDVSVEGSIGELMGTLPSGDNVRVAPAYGGIATSGGVGTTTTIDTNTEAVTPVASANLGGIVSDGAISAVTTAGSVFRSIVAGDRTTTSAGPDAPTPTLGNANDVIGILSSISGAHPANQGIRTIAPGAQAITGPISVTGGNLGTIEGNITSGAPTISGDEVSAPYGISATITVTPSAGATLTADPGIGVGQLRAAVVAGKHTAIPGDTADQSADDITGNITAVDIVGDIWAGDDITATIRATGITSFLAPGTPGSTGDVARGRIGSQGNNANLLIIATGAQGPTVSAASPDTDGDITGDILADGNIENVTIDAGTGFGGSLLASIIAGTDGSGGIIGTNVLTADEDLGASATGNDVVSAADDIFFVTVAAGLQPIASGTQPTNTGGTGGDINIDILAGVPLNQTVPVGTPALDGNAASTFLTGISDANLPIFQNEEDSITIGTLSAGSVDGPDADSDPLNDLNSNLNGTLAAAADIIINTLTIDGDAIGNNGAAGGHIAAAGLGFKAAPLSDCNLLFIGDGSQIVGDLLGTFSSGMFVPADQAGPSPLNPNDIPDGNVLQAGTVLTAGEVQIDGLTVGRWIQSETGTNGSDGIGLVELLTGAESGTGGNPAFAPAFSIGATCDILANIDVIGRPFVAPQTGVGNVSPVAADGDIVAASIAAFGTVGGTITASDSADFTFVMSNIDAITAIGTTNAAPGNPSSPTTMHNLNSGEAGDNNLNITAFGNGTGGLDVDYFLAGFDYFTRTTGNATTTPNFFASFGFGDINGSLRAEDADPTNGHENGDLTFALVAAGEDINGTLYADDDIIARLGNAITDGTTLIPCDLDADVLAGANVNNSISAFTSGSFAGGNINGNILAGDDIGSSDGLANPAITIDDLISIAAQGSSSVPTSAGNGNINGDIVSGIRDQLTGPDLFDLGDDEDGNIYAFIIAGNNLNGNVDAGDTQNAYGSSGLTSSTFRGGIHVGAGADLNIFTTGDNSPDADINGNIRTEGDLNVEDFITTSGGSTTTTTDTFTTATETETFANAPVTTMTFDQFNAATVSNPTGGTVTLTGVTITGLSSVSDGSITINRPDTTTAATGAVSVNQGTILTSAALNGGSASLSNNVSVPVSLAVGEASVTEPIPADTTGIVTLTGAALANFLGTGTIDVTASTQQGFVASGDIAGGGIQQIFNGGVFSGQVSIQYTYTVTTTVVVPGVDDICPMGILVTDDIAGVIEVGYGPQGGDLLGNVIAEGDIEEIEVWGDVGRVGYDSIIAAGGMIDTLGIGNASGMTIASGGNDSPNDLRFDSLYTNTFGDLHADVFIGGFNAADPNPNEGNGATDIFIGGDIAPGANVVMGFFAGVQSAGIQVGEDSGSITFSNGAGRIGISSAGIDIIANDTGNGIDVTTFHLDINRFITGDSLTAIHVHDGSLNQVIVDDDFDILPILQAQLDGLSVDLSDFPFFTESLPPFTDLPTTGFNDSKFSSDVGEINVEGNIGTVGVDIGVGFNPAMTNAAIVVEGNLNGPITSHNGSIGNIMIGGSITDADITARNSIGDIFITLGGLDQDNVITAETGSVGVISAQGDITAVSFGADGTNNLIVAQNLGGLISRLGHINTDDGDLRVGGSIGLLQAFAGLTGFFIAGVDIGVDLDATDKFTANGINQIHAGFIQDAQFLATRNIGNVRAYLGGIHDTDFTAGNNIGNISAFGDIAGGSTTIPGSTIPGSEGPDVVVFDEVNITAGGSIGDINSTIGSINEGLTAHAVQNINCVEASLDIRGEYVAEFGNITHFISTAGDIDVDARAGGNIGEVHAIIGNVLGTSTRVDLPTGTIITGVSGRLVAGGNIGPITALQGIGNYVIIAGGDVLAMTAELGSIGAGTEAIVNVFQFFQNTFSSGGFFSGVVPVTRAELREIGQLTVQAGDDIVSLTAGNRIDGQFTAQDDIGPVTALQGIGTGVISSDNPTRFTAGGSIGSLVTTTGDIGTDSVPVIIRANGDVEIDPETLDLVALPNTTGMGVGNIFANIGDIHIDLRTGGDVGEQVGSGASLRVRGGIAAPLGSVKGSIRVGGDLGGVAGQSVNFTEQVVLGTTQGTFRDVEAGEVFIRDGNTFTVSHNGVTYTVTIEGGVGFLSYSTPEGEPLTIEELIVDANAGQEVSIEITTSNSSLVDVERIVVNGNVANLIVEGNVDSLDISGNLRSTGSENGLLRIEGNLGTGRVSGDIGFGGNADGNAFIADGIDVQVGGLFGSLTAGRRNFGLVQVKIGNGSYFSFANSVRTGTGQGDGFITAYLKTGSAILTINNGVIERVQFLGKAASDLVILTNPRPLESNANTGDARATAKGVNRRTDALLAAQSSLVKANIEVKGANRNLIFEGPGGDGAVSDTSAQGRNDTAVVGRINVPKNFRLSNVLIEGSLGNLEGRANSVVNGVTVAGNAGRLFTANKLTNVDVRGNADVIDGGLTLTAVNVEGNAGIIKATRTVKAVNVEGDVDSVVSGNLLQNVFIGGDAHIVSANIIKNLQVTGDLDHIGARKSATFVAVGGEIQDLFFTSTGNDMSYLLAQVRDDAYIGYQIGNKAFVIEDGVLIQTPADDNSFFNIARRLITIGNNIANPPAGNGGNGTDGFNFPGLFPTDLA